MGLVAIGRVAEREDCAFQTAKIHICGDKMGRSYASSLVVLCRTIRFWGGQKRQFPLAKGSLGSILLCISNLLAVGHLRMA